PPPPRPTLFPYTTLFRSFALHLFQIFFVAAIGDILSEDHDARIPPHLFGECSVDCIDHRLGRTFKPRRRGERVRSWIHGWRVERSEEHTSELQSRENLVC